MSFAVLRGRETVILFENTVKGAGAIKTRTYSNFKQRLITFQHGTRGMLAAQGIDECTRRAAHRFIEQM